MHVCSVAFARAGSTMEPTIVQVSMSSLCSMERTVLFKSSDWVVSGLAIQVWHIVKFTFSVFYESYIYCISLYVSNM